MKRMRLPRLEQQRAAGAGQIVRCVYLRVAQAYMLISMPTGTSTIFGVFQLIGISQVVWRDVHAKVEPMAASNVMQVPASASGATISVRSKDPSGRIVDLVQTADRMRFILAAISTIAKALVRREC